MVGMAGVMTIRKGHRMARVGEHMDAASIWMPLDVKLLEMRPPTARDGLFAEGASYNFSSLGMGRRRG